jgi:hypothetical protein
LGWSVDLAVGRAQRILSSMAETYERMGKFEDISAELNDAR